MFLNRRQFLILSAGFAAGCGTAEHPTSKERAFDVGPASDYAADGVYNGFRAQGFFIIRQGESLVALSSICTHRKCKITAKPDHSYYCKCHGSTFDTSGHVTHGPAKRNLPTWLITTDPAGHLWVHVQS